MRTLLSRVASPVKENVCINVWKVGKTLARSRRGVIGRVSIDIMCRFSAFFGGGEGNLENAHAENV